MLYETLEMLYEKLENLLVQKKWKEADILTAQILLIVAGRERYGWLDRYSIENLSCRELCDIDYLWLQNSQGKFGFSVQTKIWLMLGGNFNYTTEMRLSEYLGWRKKAKWIDYDQVTFDLNTSCLGHLPVSNGTYHKPPPGMGYVRPIVNCSLIFLSRVKKCTI